MQLEVHQPPPETATVPRQLRTLPSLCFTSGYLQILGQLFEFGEIIEILQYDAAVVKQRQIVLNQVLFDVVSFLLFLRCAKNENSFFCHNSCETNKQCSR
jgi:hypothetical protein